MASGCMAGRGGYIHLPLTHLTDKCLRGPWPGAHFVGSYPSSAITCLMTLDESPGLSVPPAPQQLEH